MNLTSCRGLIQFRLQRIYIFLGRASPGCHRNFSAFINGKGSLAIKTGAM